MQSTKGLTKLRPISRNLFKHTNKFLTTQRPRAMSLFPRYATANPYDGGFRSLFRMMDDIATNYENATPSSTAIRAFSPKFDVVEAKDAYHLHGELPGLDQKDVSIEFTDPHTLIIKGHVEHRYEHSEPTDEGDKKATDASHKATVEDESAEKSKESKESKETAVTTTDEGKKDVAKVRHHKTKYWVSERSVGEFHRSFSFPSLVDQDGVKATLKQGVLNITVPKISATKGSRRINIESVE
jgi:HSP20 family protein